MRRLVLMMLGAACLSLAGCFLVEPMGKALWPKRQRPGEGPVGPDVVVMDVSVLVAPVGDRYVNEEVWTEADEQVLSAEARAALRDSGLRVGIVTGRSDKLLELLTSKRSNPNQMRYQHRSGNP